MYLSFLYDYYMISFYLQHDLQQLVLTMSNNFVPICFMDGLVGNIFIFLSLWFILLTHSPTFMEDVWELSSLAVICFRLSLAGFLIMQPDPIFVTGSVISLMLTSLLSIVFCVFCHFSLPFVFVVTFALCLIHCNHSVVSCWFCLIPRCLMCCFFLSLS